MSAARVEAYRFQWPQVHMCVEYGFRLTIYSWESSGAGKFVAYDQSGKPSIACSFACIAVHSHSTSRKMLLCQGTDNPATNGFAVYLVVPARIGCPASFPRRTARITVINRTTLGWSHRVHCSNHVQQAQKAIAVKYPLSLH